MNHQEKPRLHIVLDNIRSAFNVGSIFRTADATGTAKIYLCGITPNIENPKLSKTALGALQSVPSEYYSDTQKALDEISKKGIPIYGIELTEDSEHFQKVDYPNEVALVLGHEINGVNQLVIDRCEKLIYIPMKGIKESLNVANTASILMFEALRS
jgi:tRNA G18 (ribose-2'-O)-methylase SpoU